MKILGQVESGARTTFVLARSKIRSKGHSLDLVNAYPIEAETPAWKHLKNADPTQLKAALRPIIEERESGIW